MSTPAYTPGAEPVGGPVDLELPPDSIERHKAVGLWWRAGGTLAESMESGRGIAPSHIYPTGSTSTADDAAAERRQ